jgi:dienelactone hydrolase
MSDCEQVSQTLDGPKECIKPQLREGLVSRRTRLQSQLKDLDAAIEALDANPEVAKLLELVGKASRY